MKVRNLEDILESLLKKKQFLHAEFGVTRLGIFGSFVQGSQKDSSDIDMVVEVEKEKKNLHNFLQLKRLLENEFGRPVDLGFESSLKPIIREKIKGKITYV